MLDLDNFGSTPVTLLKKSSSKKDYISLIKQLTQEGKCRVFSVHQNPKTVKYLHSYFDIAYPEIRCQKLMDGKDKMRKVKLYISDFESTRKILLENLTKRTVDFCSVLLINDIHFDTPEKTFFILLWLEIFKRSDSRPFLLMTTDCYLIPEIPFELDKISIQEAETEKKSDINIRYHNENYSPSSDETVNGIVEVTRKMHIDYPVSEEDKSLWLIFYAGKKNLSVLNRNLYDKIEDLSVYSYKNITDFSKVVQKGTRTVITIDSFYEDNIFLEPDGIIDGMVSEYQDENNKLFYKYSSKQSAEVKASYLKKGFCYRLCTEDFYQNLQKVELSSFSLANLEKYMLQISLREIPITPFFEPLVKREKISEITEKLKILGNIDQAGKITTLGKVTQKLNLNVANSSLLLDWIKNGEPGFPMIVFLVFSELNYSFIYFPSKRKEESRKDYISRKEDLILNYYKTSYETIFELYLKIFVMIISTEQTINIKNYNLLCKKYSLNYLAVKEVFDKIKFLVDYFKDKVKIGVFNVENLIHLSKEYLEKYFYQDVGNLIDEKKGLYCFPNSEVYRLENHKHFSKTNSFPSRLVAFEKYKINDSIDSIQKSKNIIYYFVPLDNTYIENE